MRRKSRRPLMSGSRLRPFDEKSGVVHALVDTPKGSRNKFKFDTERGLYKLAGVLPAGAVYIPKSFLSCGTVLRRTKE